MTGPMPMFKCRDGSLEVVDVVGDEQLVARLLELGLCRGRRLRMVRDGNPAIVNVAGTRLALSHDLQQCVYLQRGAM